VGHGSGELRRQRFGEGERDSEGMRASSGRERELGPVPFIGRGEERERGGGSNGAGVLQAPSMTTFNGGENVGEGERETGGGFWLRQRTSADAEGGRGVERGAGMGRAPGGGATRGEGEGLGRAPPAIERGEEVGAAGRLGPGGPKWPVD
jgi:hypothetical protein